MLQKFVSYNWADSYGFLAKLNQFLPKSLLPEMSVLRPGFVKIYLVLTEIKTCPLSL
jgi:hypothetical protein